MPSKRSPKRLTQKHSPSRSTDRSSLNETWFRTTLYSIGDAVIACDRRGRVEMMNPVAEKLTGWTEARARGKALSSVFKIVNEETRKKVPNPVARVLREGIVIGLANHTLLLSRNGGEYPIADAGAPIKDDNGKVVGVVLVFRDQTLERKTQRAVQDARELAESIIATVREPLLVLDEKLEVVAANRSFYNVFKVKPEETIGRKIYYLGNRQWNIPRLRKLLEDILPSNSHFDDFEITHDFEHIGRRTMVLNARRLFREANRTKLILLAIEDITERKRAEETMRESERRYRMLFNHVRDAILISDASARYVSVNDEATALTGYSREVLLHMTVGDLVVGDRQDLIEGYREFHRAMRTRRIFHAADHQMRRKDGSIFWYEVNCVYLLDDNVMAMVRDITERKQTEEALRESEERFRLLAESSLTGIYLIQDQTFAYVNQSLAATFGYTVEEIVGKLGPLDLTHPDDRPRVLENIRRRVAGEVEALRYDFQGVKKDGTIIFLEVHGRRIEYAGRVGIIGTLVDITERKRAESLRLRLSQVLESIAGNEALPHILERLVRAIEEYVPDMKGSVLLLDATGKRLHHGAAPSLPDDYNTAIDGLLIGPRVGSCGTAAYEKRLVIVEDIQTDPLWADFRDLAAKHGLRACWSQPIIDHEGAVLGTLALYYQEPRKPTQAELELINTAANIAGIAIKRKRAEQSLRENEQRYRSIVENINQAYYEADRRAIFTYCNPGLLIISGYTAEELLGTVSYRLIAEEDRQKVIAQYERWLKEKRTDMAMEFRVRTKSGRIFWVEQVTHFEFDEKGNFVKATNVLRDIDERKRAEEELQRSHEWLNSIFEASRDGIIVEEDEQIVYVNRAAAELYGYGDPRELIGKHVSLVQSDEDNERMLEYGRNRKRGEPAPTLYEFKGRRKDGSLFDCEMSVSQATIGGRRLIIAMLRDITERKKAEREILQSRERYERFFLEDLSGDYISTPEGRLLACNPTFVRIFGFSSVEEALATNAVTLFQSPEEGERLLSRLQRERKLEYYEMKMRKLDGTPLYIVANIIGRFDEHDRLVEMQGYLFDDTKRHQAEEALRQAQKMESLGVLASGIAHDFNNILGIIMGHVLLLEKYRIDPTRFSRSVDAITSATQRGASLVRQMLTFARKAESVFEPLEVNLLVKEMAKLLFETFPRTITIEHYLDPHLPPIIADATQIHQVLLNLCVNARDAMPGGGKLTLSSRQAEGRELAHRFPDIMAERYVELTVSDTGVGMDEKTLGRIFEPFFTTKAPGHGTGLGLSVVYGIVRTHGGFIDVESQPGRGTTFHIYLPAAPRPIQYQAAPRKEALPEGGTETILIVEDEEGLRQVLESSLTSAGYTVIAASDGEQALKLYAERMQEIALVVSDIGIPNVSGEEVFRRIRQMNPAAKVILASGFIEPDAKRKLSKEGVKDFIGKPYTVAEILKKTRTVLDAGR